MLDTLLLRLPLHFTQLHFTCMFCEINSESVQEEGLVRHHTFLRDLRTELKCDIIYIYERPCVSIVENSKIAEVTWFKPFFSPPLKFLTSM